MKGPAAEIRALFDHKVHDMSNPTPLVDVFRGDFLESQHCGDWVVVNKSGEIIDGAGDHTKVILPRSSLKPVQAIPLVESGAIDRFRLSTEEIALACASHSGARMHTTRVSDWLDQMGYSETALLCGVQPPQFAQDREILRDQGCRANQTHNNCSGKHTGFLTLTKILKAGPDYIDPDHPVQIAARDAVAELTGEDTFGYAIDGCSAPNFAVRLQGLARSMARIANAQESDVSRRDRAAFQIRTAMSAHPELVAGEVR